MGDGRTDGPSRHTEGCPGCTVCAALSLAFAVLAVGIAYSLVVTTLMSVPELAAAAAVYVFFLVWGLAWLLFTAGYQRAAHTDRRQPRQRT